MAKAVNHTIFETSYAYLQVGEGGQAKLFNKAIHIYIAALGPCLPDCIDPLWFQHMDIWSLLRHMFVLWSVDVAHNQMRNVSGQVEAVYGAHVGGDICKDCLRLSC